MQSFSHIKCPYCGTFNTNRDHCQSCNRLISHQKKQAARATQIVASELQEIRKDLEKETTVKRFKRHPFFLIRMLGWCLQSIWFVLNVIGGLLAWFIAMFAAG